jgi:hypothetical protein
MPDDNKTDAKRAMTSTAPEDRAGGAIFDGTGDYQSWRRAQQVEAFMHDSSVAAAKVVFRRVRGTAIETMLAAVSTSNLAAFPFSSVDGILEALDLVYGGTGAYNKVEALRQLMRLRQGNQSFEDYIAKFQALAAKSQLDRPSLIGALQAGVNTKLAPAAAMIDESQEIGAAINRLKKVDQMTPNAVFKPRNDKPTRGRAANTGGRNGSRDMSKVECYNCGEKGHLSRNCSKPRKARKGKIAEINPEESETDDIVEYTHMSGNE